MGFDVETFKLIRSGEVMLLAQMNFDAISGLSSALSGMFGGVIAFFVSPYISRWWFGPDLTLSFDPKGPCAALYPTGKYIKIMIENRGKPALKCRAYLASVEAVDCKAHQEQFPYKEFLPLPWSWSSFKFNDKPIFPESLTITSGMKAYVDVAFACKAKTPSAADTASITLPPQIDQFKEIIVSGNVYHVVVVVVAENTVPKKIKLRLSYEGHFSSLTASVAEQCSKA